MACGRCLAAASISARTRATPRSGGELRDEVGGSSDTCRWVTRAEVEDLPIVELVRAGLSLAFGG